MANTAKLNLPLIDDNMVADVPRDVNAIANGIDARAGAANGLATLGADGKVPAAQLSVSTPPDASTTRKGIVQLNDTVTSTSTTQAATANAVRTVQETVNAHSADSTKHVTAAERTKWNNAVTDIGTKSNLRTSVKSDLVSAINELFQSANDGKNAIASAVSGKGIPATGSDTFVQLASKIGQINTGRKFAAGTFTSTPGTAAQVSGLGFTPRNIIITGPSNTWGIHTLDAKSGTTATDKVLYNSYEYTNRFTPNSNGFTCNLSVMAGGTYYYYATE